MPTERLSVRQIREVLRLYQRRNVPTRRCPQPQPGSRRSATAHAVAAARAAQGKFDGRRHGGGWLGLCLALGAQIKRYAEAASAWGAVTPQHFSRTCRGAPRAPLSFETSVAC
jgi:hypothetical protein